MELLERKLPKRTRFSVYKKAYKLIKCAKPGEKYAKLDQENLELCLLLPVILWNLKDFLDDAPNGKPWIYCHTKIAFPEIETYLNSITECNLEDRNRRRLEVLEEIIKNQ